MADGTARGTCMQISSLHSFTSPAHRSGKAQRCPHYLQFLDELLQIALGGLLGHNIKHLSADGAHLTRLGVAGGLGLLVDLLLGESDAEHAENIAIGGAHINKGLDKSLPLSDKGAQLVASDVHAVKVCQNVIAVHILAHEFNLAVTLALVTSIEIGKRYFEHTTLEAFGGNFWRGLLAHTTISHEMDTYLFP